mmetsp:Transcript_13998/g.28391  ORF Transcript_13998/g.28391 Transcript_13998/m.28391 type:complete len:270 (+) Transcript_13998:124-933(+)
MLWTHLGINGQLWQFESGSRILVDPILIGDLTFFGLPGLYKAKPRVPCDAALRDAVLAGDFDALLLSQGWEDHVHPPTLTALKAAGALRPDVPIIGPPSAAAAVVSCGLSDSFVKLAHGESQVVCDVTVRAVPGALLGPPWARRENALCVTGGGEPPGCGLFYEPHGEWGADQDLAALEPEVGILVAPAVAMKVGPLFELVHGAGALRRAAELLRPHTAVALLNGDIDATGLSAPFVYGDGSFDDSERALQAVGVQLVTPMTGVPVKLQ